MGGDYTGGKITRRVYQKLHLQLYFYLRIYEGSLFTSGKLSFGFQPASFDPFPCHRTSTCKVVLCVSCVYFYSRLCATALLMSRYFQHFLGVSLFISFFNCVRTYLPGTTVGGAVVLCRFQPGQGGCGSFPALENPGRSHTARLTHQATLVMLC